MHHTHFISSVLLGVACSIIGVTINVIMAKEAIANWWFRFGEKVGKDIVQGQEQERWFYRPIWGCEKCFSGQLALWIYFFSHIHGNSPVDWQDNGWFSLPGYSIFSHILAVCTAIFTAVIFSHIINKIKEND
jgi:hypothetical protein